MWRALCHLQLRSLSLRISEYIAKKRVDAPASDDVRYADFLFVLPKSSAPQQCTQNGWLYGCATDSFALKFAIIALFLPIHSFFYFLYFFLPYRKKAYFCQKEKWGGKECKHAESRLIVQTLFGQRYICCEAHWRFIFVKWAFMWKFFKHNLTLVVSLNYAA